MGDVISIAIPRETVNDESILILSWKILSGASVEKDQLLCEVETSKAVMEIYAPSRGVLRYTAAAGDEVPIGAIICWIASADAGGGNAMGAAAPGDTLEVVPPAATPRFTPAARVLAEQHGIDPASFPPGALVRSADVLRKAGKGVAAAADSRREAAAAAAPGVPVTWADLSRRKKLEGRILHEASSRSVRSSVTSTCRIGQLRTRMDADFPVSRIALSALVIFELARLLKKYALFNSLYDRGRIGQYGQVNLGWAIDGGEGLVVPVIRDADRKSLREIAAALDDHVNAYLENRLLPQDLAGPTFTVSDLSKQGVRCFEPLMGPGQSAILGIGGETDSWDGEILHLTLAFDHRLATGREAAALLAELSGRLEAHAGLCRAPVFCVLCQRDANSLKALKGILIRSELPPGYVCSICLAGNQ